MRPSLGNPAAKRGDFISVEERFRFGKRIVVAMMLL
jgi:hypothetical protein